MAVSTAPGGPDPWIERSLEGGRYTVKSRLGGGGMGQVYLARQHTMDRDVAVKIMAGHLRHHPDARSRFVREAKLTGSINHPNVITVYDYGVEPDGALFLVMERLEGRPLSEVIREVGPLPLVRVRRIALQICDALHAAHSGGVIHRDLKPANVMMLSGPVTPDTLKVLDFGLARSVLPEAEFTELTQAGKMFGSPAYMPPEVALGRNCDHRGDVYALGVMLYEMITGHPPFAHIERLLVPAAHVREAVPPLPADAPAACQSLIVDRMLAKQPSDRPQSIDEVRDLLTHLFDDLSPGRLARAVSVPVRVMGALDLPPPPSSQVDADGETLPPVSVGAETPLIPASALPLPSEGPSAPPAPVTARPRRWPWLAGALALLAAVAIWAIPGEPVDRDPPTEAPAVLRIADAEGFDAAKVLDAEAIDAEVADAQAADAQAADAQAADAQAADAQAADAQATDAQATDAEPAASSVPLKVRSAPSGAIVRVNGARVGRTPYDGRMPLEGGSVTLHKRGYLSYNSMHGWQRPGEALTVDARLTKAPPPTIAARFDVRSTPSGATITLNGVEKGTTDSVISHRVPKGSEVEVRLSKRGYAPYTQTVKPTDKTIRIKTRLRPMP